MSGYTKAKEVMEMLGNKIKLDYDEKKVIIMALIELKNKLIEEDRYTDRVDDLIWKLTEY